MQFLNQYWHGINNIHCQKYKNKYKETPIRRFCIFRYGQTSMDDLPFLWYQWIRYQRNYPPTAQELQEYDDYIEETQAKAEKIKQRDDALRAANPEYYEEQKKRLEETQEELTNKAQKEVIAMFQSRENALRLAAENKVAKMKQADNIIESERRRYEEMQFQKQQEEFNDPASAEPTDTSNMDDTDKEQTAFKPGAWRPWADDNEDAEAPGPSSQSK